MKIVHLCLCGPVTDGWTYQDNLLPKYHKKEGHDVTVITSQWIWGHDGKIAFFNKTNYVNEDLVKVIRLPIRKGNVHSKLKRYIGLDVELDKEQPEILFIHGCQFLDMSVVVSYLKEHEKVITYVDNHADLSNSATNFLSRYLLHGILWKHSAKLILPYTKKFYGVLPARVDFLNEIYKVPREKCELLVMGTDDEMVCMTSNPQAALNLRNEYGIDKNDFLIMTGGKIDSYKRQTLLLMDAINQINNPCVKLLVFGSVADDLKQEVEFRCSEKVQYIGWIQPLDTYQFFASSDLVVFPGRHSVFWEQVVGQGIPMLCKQWKGTNHVDLGGNVRFISGDSIDEIKENIEDLLDNPQKYEKMKKIAIERGKRYFSYSDIARRSIL